MRAKVTTHVLLGCKSLGCPARVTRGGRSDLGGEQTVRLEHNEIAAASKPSPRKIVFAETKREADPILLMGKAEDTEEEPGKRTQWNRRGMGSGITGQIRRITSGRSWWQQGRVATCTDSSNEAKSRRRGEPHRIGE